jgi:MYXO-CTERM domain-containing protein
MSMRTKFTMGLVALASVAGLASAAVTDINSLKVQTRIFNDFPVSTLSVSYTNANSRPVYLQFSEQFPQGAVGNFANKHEGFFSSDGGNTTYDFGQNESFTISTTVKIETSGGQPRKEAGLFFRNPHQTDGWTNEGLFMVASDGEVAIFGGGLAFHSFGRNAYTLGTEATLSFRFYRAGELGAFAAYEATFNGVSSGVKFADDAAFNGFNAGSSIALHAQNQRNPFIADSVTTTYSNISVVPTPGAMALLGLAGLVAGSRRRR